MEDIIDILETLFFYLKILLGIISTLFITLGIYFAIKSNFWEKKIKQVFVDYRKAPKVDVDNKVYDATKTWEAIQERADSDDEGDWKLAIIEADKLIDTILKAHSISGETMADRMRNVSQARMPSIDNLWKVHRLRNHLVHTSDFHITHNQAKQAMNIYQQILIEMKAIDS